MFEPAIFVTVWIGGLGGFAAAFVDDEIKPSSPSSSTVPRISALIPRSGSIFLFS
jgi:hypothetical protein